MKRKIYQILTALIIAMVAVGATTMSILRAADGGVPEFGKNEVLSELISPDKQWKAVIFERHLGLLGRDTTDVSIIRASDALKNEPGNAFSLEATAGYTLLSVEWTTPHQVTITYKRDEVVSFAARAVSLIALSYKLAPQAVKNR